MTQVAKRPRMDWLRYAALGRQWRAEGRAYAQAVGAYVQRGLATGDYGPRPSDPRGPMAMDVLAIAKEANEAGEIAALRRGFPPAYEPFVPHIEQHAVPVTNVVWSEDSIFALLGHAHAVEDALHVHLDGRVQYADEVLRVGRGRSPGAVVCGLPDRIEEYDDVVRTYRIPSGLVGPVYLGLEATRDGRILAVFPEGVFLCGKNSVKRLFPTDAAQVPRRRFSMMRGVQSPDGSLVACSHEGGPHHILRLDGRCFATVVPASGHLPCHATFTPDGKALVASSCTDRTGGSVVVSLRARPGTRELPLSGHQGWLRVTAAVFVGDEYIVGDLCGYLRGFTLDGTCRWQHACGSTITGLDASPDGRRLAVGTAAGVLHIIELHCATPDPYQVGTASHREVLRLVRWRGSGLLRW